MKTRKLLVVLVLVSFSCSFSLSPHRYFTFTLEHFLYYNNHPHIFTILTLLCSVTSLALYCSVQVDVICVLKLVNVICVLKLVNITALTYKQLT